MKTTDKTIIEKLKEVNKVYKDFTSWIFRHTIEITQSIRGTEYINKIRQLESEIASLEAQDKEPEERFVKPTDKELIEIALLFNDGKVQETKLRDMVAMSEFIIDRLYENGNVQKPSSKE